MYLYLKSSKRIIMEKIIVIKPSKNNKLNKVNAWWLKNQI